MDLAEISQKRNSEISQFFLNNFDLVASFVRERAIAKLCPTAIGSRNYWNVIEDICQEVFDRGTKHFQYPSILQYRTTQDLLFILECILLRILKDVIRDWCLLNGIDYEKANNPIERFLQEEKLVQAIIQAVFVALARRSLQCGIDIQDRQFILLAPPLKKKQRHRRKLSDVIASQKLTSKDASLSLNTRVIKFISHCVVREREMYVRGIYTPVSISSKAG